MLKQAERKLSNDQTLALRAFRHMCSVSTMATVYDENRKIARYVHSTSRGHEAIQLAAGYQLQPYDYGAFYYRDESILLGIGFEPYELMLQLLARRDDPFSGGRSYYGHPSVRRDDMPRVPHQSAATGMQAIPATGAAHALKYLEGRNMLQTPEPPLVLCSLGDGSVTEGEVSEAFQMAVLKELPVLYLVQDNDWGISASGREMRAMDAYDFAAGFKGLKRKRVDGSDFMGSYEAVKELIKYVRKQRKPALLHARVPLLGHHTSGVRREWYRDDYEQHQKDDPLPRLRDYLLGEGFEAEELDQIQDELDGDIRAQFQQAVDAPEPAPASLYEHAFAPTPITEEKGERSPKGGKKVVMVDAALHALDEILSQHPGAMFYGQDVGKRLGGVFREAATLAGKYGDDRIFNTPIQEAYIIGSTAGMSAAGVRAIVEIQFADYLWPGVNQLVTELSKSCYLSMGKYPVASVIRVPIGAYGGGGPYHSGSVESSILPVKGLKIAYPSNGADLKGLLKSAYYDPNPVVMFEHKGLYWSKVPGTEAAKTVEPDADYVIPFGKGRIALEADPAKIEEGDSAVLITYGMGVHWGLNAAQELGGRLEVVDLRTLYPLDEKLIGERVALHGKCAVVTEEPLQNSFAESLAGRIQRDHFQKLDAPVQLLGAENLPGIPVNLKLEAEMLPSALSVRDLVQNLLDF